MKHRLQDWAVLVALLSISILTLAARNESLFLGIRSIALQSTAGIENQIANFREYFEIAEDNDRLREDNIRLSSELARIREAGIDNEELRRLLRLDSDSPMDVVAGRIVTKDITRRDNYLTLDVGRQDSVEVGMPVINTDGVVGRVFFVSRDYSRVLPFLNVESRIPAKIQISGAEGIVRWDGTDRRLLQLDHVVKTVSAETGQEVVTSGNSSSYPPGYPIGTIASVDIQQGRNELKISLEPAVDFDQIKYVFVVRQLPSPELDEATSQSVSQ